MGMTGALAAAAAIWRTAAVHPTPHHTLISLSATRSVSSLLGSTTPSDRVASILPSSNPKHFSAVYGSGYPVSIFCYQILFETEEDDEQEATTSLALAKEINVGFAVEAVSAVVAVLLVWHA